MGSECLYYLLSLAKICVGKKEDWTEKDGDAGFQEYFDVKRFEKGGWKFGGTISTDGNGVSILLRRPKRKRTTSEPPLLKVEDEPVIWGVNPGKKNLFTAVNNRGDTLSCKTTRFYHDAYYTQSKIVIKGIYDKSPNIKAGFKTCPPTRLRPW
ncbi:hypothetical protein H632_c2430p0 [Helicosporidium sp. ATCC 50920]|nr:hypothetical protein H632_c2430p0 [Helicosporidium sp. ATCC 50920]|eukprot:KDD73203.1 hypothetical protein H632_c2430p0 [Helicosporidium sp. ATCC 50920]